MIENSRKKVFIISPSFIFPAVGANHKDILGHIFLFKKIGYNVFLVYYYNNDFNKTKTKAYESKYQIKLFPLKTGSPVYKNKFTYFYQAEAHFSENSINALQKLILDEKPDILFFEYSRFAYLAKILNPGNAKVIFRSHNFELLHSFEKDNLNRGKGSKEIVKLILHSWKKWKSIYNNEKLMFKIASEVLSISYNDMQCFKRYYNASNIFYWPPFLPDIPGNYTVKKHNVLNVVYMGSNFNNNINYSGAVYLLEKIIPSLDKEDISNKFVFHITGNGSEILTKMNTRTNVVFHGFIPDIYSFLDRMDISCLPVKAGRGCKIKMFESLAMGIPTIGFKKTFYGIPSAENCYETAETPIQFVKALNKMMSFEYRTNLSKNSRNFIRHNASEKLILNTLRKIL